MGNMVKYLGRKIKEIRKSKGYTQTELAEKIDVDSKYLSRIETGLASPSLKTIEKLVEVLPADVGQLFDFSEYKDREQILEELTEKIKICPSENLKLILDFTNMMLLKKISRH